ncbi:alpha/beta fold hydrolase [Cytobacillus sp. FJAT-54145]|uniref:Alpha/beta fold hydrolase n=1 Tax=Cytobacillus spartinae TaxID=3299023 RepID=A0ABW6K5W7_9BACI
MQFYLENRSLFYEIYGEGHPIIILHAMGTDHQSMKAWMEPIFDTFEGFQRIYIDIPAHGKSMIDEKIKSTQDMLEFILKFIDQTLPQKEFSLIGHSFGGYIAQGIMHSRISNVKGLCLLASALHQKNRTVPERVVVKRDEHELTQMDSDIQLAFDTLMVYQTKDNLEKFLNEVQPGRLLANKEFLSSNWRENGYYLKEEPLLNQSEVSQPALFLLGKHDSICGYKDHLEYLNKFKNGTVSILDTGHLMAIEKRSVVQMLVKDWVMNLY